MMLDEMTQAKHFKICNIFGIQKSTCVFIAFLIVLIINLAAKRENKKLSTSIWVFEFQKVGHFMMHKPPISVELYLIQYMGWKNIAKKYYTIVLVMESGDQISVFGLKES